MPQVKFTDRLISSLTVPPAGQVDYFDKNTRGFGVRVSYGGSKSFFVKYVHNGRQRRMSLGQYPALKLADARKLALGAKHELVVERTDPAAQKKTDREAMTFKALADLYVTEHAMEKKRSWREDERILNKYFAAWHARKAAEIERAEIAEQLQTIKRNHGGIMANRCLACVRKMYSYALKNGKLSLTHNPAQNLDRPADEVERDRVYSDDEITRLWDAFGQCGVAGSVLKMCLASGQRLREVMGMAKAEIDDELWTLPGARTKNKRTHVVPLNDLAFELLEETASLSEAWAFPSPRDAAKPVATIGKVRLKVRKLSGVGDFEPHDLRRCFSTGITRLGFSRFLADRLLNHVEPGVGRVYDRYDYFREKVEASAAWGRHLSAVVGEGNGVVQLVPPQRA